MKGSVVLPVVLAAAGAAGLCLYLLRSGADEGRPPAAPAAQVPVASPGRVRHPAAGAVGAAVAPALEPTAPPGSYDDSEAVTVARGETVATVNDVAITGEDLIAFRARDGDEQQMTPAMYDFVVRRAIERELTFQAARARASSG